jgi:hypothetical protein
MVCATRGRAKTRGKRAAHLRRAVRKIQFGSEERIFPTNSRVQNLPDTSGQMP